MYYQMKVDKNGLPKYRCVRGTNSVEGSIHQKIVQQFGAFNASPQLADALLAEFRHRHNERCSIRNRTNHPNIGILLFLNKYFKFRSL
jgi:hypothetical protein